MEDLYIVGSGGFAREVAVLIEALNASAIRFNLKGFVVDAKYFAPGTFVAGLPVFNIDEMDFPGSFAIAIGDSVVRERIREFLTKKNACVKFPPLIHPRASIGARILIGQGTIICDGCIMTCDIKVGDFVIVNLNTTVGHDAQLGDYCTINPTSTISGNVQLGEHVFVGTGANILEKLNIGNNAVIGGGSLVRRDVLPRTTVVGIPAREVSKVPK